MNRAKAHKALDELLDAIAESTAEVPEAPPSKSRRKLADTDIAKARTALRKIGVRS